MNLRGIANRATSSINPNISATLRRYIGETIGPGRKPLPQYGPDEKVFLQLQPLSKGDIQHVDGLNIQGLAKSVHINGNFYSANRTLDKGGDIFIIDGRTWLVVEPLELWPDWCRLLVVLQVDT
ncbi:hypothetical protein ACOJCY_002655 [Cronobacter dublinensis]